MFKVSLIVVSGKPEGKMITLTGPTFRIGRDESCHLRPNSVEVSRRHMEIVVNDDAVIVSDLGSRNGTLVNNQVITGPHALKNGELLKVGPLTFAVSIQGATEGDSSPPNASANGTKPTPGSGGQGKIESWLLADNARPTPDRPSGVYDGDTLTLDAYNAPPPKPASSSAQPTRSAYDDMNFEHLEEGAGDADEESAEGADQDTDDEAGQAEEFIDESNPFYIAKKAAAAASAQQSSKVDYKDTSDAANDILRKMLERRRASRP
jgi:pSer/pThr/pTyr-binding forkhead associated (FHA) protein